MNQSTSLLDSLPTLPDSPFEPRTPANLVKYINQVLLGARMADRINEERFNEDADKKKDERIKTTFLYALAMLEQNPKLPRLPVLTGRSDNDLLALRVWAAVAAQQTASAEDTPNTIRPIASINSQRIDLHEPYESVDWFKHQFGLTADALMGQKKRGKLATIKRGYWNLYSVPDAKKIWSDLVDHGPDDSN